MPRTMSAIGLDTFTSFGPFLRYLRRRAQITQRELAIAVGYSESHIARLEQDQRRPNHSIILALFVPALGLEDEPELVARLLELATAAQEAPSIGAPGGDQEQAEITIGPPIETGAEAPPLPQ